MVFPELNEPAVERQQAGPDGVVAVTPVQRPGRDPARSAAVVLGDEVVRRELLPVRDERRPRREQDRDRVGLHPVPRDRSLVVAGPGLEGDARMIVVGEVGRGDLAGAGQVGLRIEGGHRARRKGPAPEPAEAVLVEAVPPVARRRDAVGEGRRPEIQVLDGLRELRPLPRAQRRGVRGDRRRQVLDAAGRSRLDHVDGVVVADAVDAELVHPVEADVLDELLRAGVVVVEIEQPGKPATEGADVGAVRAVQVEVAVGEPRGRRRARPGVVEDAVHDDVDAGVVKLGEEALEARALDGLLGGDGVVRVPVLDGEVGDGRVSPVEVVVGPGRPRQELDRVHAERGAEVGDPLASLLDGRIEARDLRREVVDVELVDDEVAVRLPPAGHRAHGRVDRRGPDDDPGTVGAGPAPARAGIGHRPRRAVAEVDQVVIVVKALGKSRGRHLPDRPLPRGVRAGRQPVGGDLGAGWLTERGLERPDHEDRIDLRITVAGRFATRDELGRVGKEE